VRRLQLDGTGDLRLVRLVPTGGANAPGVSVLESRKAVIGRRCDEVITVLSEKLEKLGRDTRTDGVGAPIILIRVAAAVSIPTGERLMGTADERAT